jgi:hypothetical protein
MNHSITEISTSAQSLETKNVELLAEKAILGSEVSVKNLAAEKFGLAEVKRGQVGVFNRQFGTFDYR